MAPSSKPERSIDSLLSEAVAEATERLSLWLDTQFTAEISAVKWEYPTPPKVRDIVDTGRLRASQTRTVAADGSVIFTWPVDYAAQVHEGGVDTRGRRFPGRPWTKVPMTAAPAKFGEFLRAAMEEQK